MELTQNVELIGNIVNLIALPLIGSLMFYSIKKRQAESEAQKAEAEARKSEADNITSYATEWKELYEKKEQKVQELDAKIDKLYQEKEGDRQKIRELNEQNSSLKLQIQSLTFKKCEVKGCGKREPQSGF